MTAPAKASTEVLSTFAADAFHFMAPDALLALEASPQAEWLIVDGGTSSNSQLPAVSVPASAAKASA